MNVVVPLFLLAPLVLVPLGYRLLEVASPGSRPPAIVLRLVLPAAGLLVISFWVPTGAAAGLLALPWLAVTGLTALAAGTRWMRDPDRLRPDVRHATDAAVAFLAVGAVFALTDRLGVRPFGFSATIILLTAVHFHFAGFVLPLAGALAWARRPGRWLEAALGAVVFGIPITALGFFGLPMVDWLGAALTAAGGFGIGLATLAVARSMAKGSAIVLAAMAGGSLLVSMPLAVIHATGSLTGVVWLGIDTMARLHGGLNALGFALPVVLAWTLDRRARTPIDEAARSAPTAIDPRRPGLTAAAIVAGYAGVVGLISANAGGTDLGPPEVIPRPVILALLLMLPAAIAAIGSWRRSGPVLIAAGVICLAQAFIAYSLVTLPFAIPGILLLVIGGRTAAVPHPRRAALGALVIVVLGIGSWFALLGTTEEICWVARNGANGELVYTQIPVTNSVTVGIDDVASGCDGGTMTTRGIALAAILAIGAIAVAELSARPTERPAPIGGGQGGPAGPLDVLRFNAVPFVLGPLVAIVAAVLALAPLPLVLRVALAFVAVAAAALSGSAIVAVVWVFGIGARWRWTWVAQAAGNPVRWLNVTTGFDDSTDAMRELLPGSEGTVVDVFDPTIEHEAALLRARRRFPPAVPSSSPDDLTSAIEGAVYDTAFLLMSAHETHDRRSFLAAVTDSLAPSGRIVLVEHLRDLPNRLAFGPGADHFQARATWLAVAADAGFAATTEVRLTPYVRGFVFERSQP